MRIARLDLFGFKSFVDRTSIHFGHGISCVVGPNGSGKSNVVDALKWCLGEQSARSLRGSEMQDVIFAGSADRRPVGFAEVQLTLRTERDQPFPGDYSALAEVQVGRRLHRSGASEYLINQARVRRKDVVELLMDSGIGNNLYSFIEQGEIDKVITASPEQRRLVIDEAAGIARYKTRRTEALIRLDQTSAQLDRASDVVDEMQRRLSGLERQVIRAAEYRRLATLVRHAELTLTLAKVFGLKAERRALRDEDHEIREALAVAEADLDQHGQHIAGRREEAAVIEARVSVLRDQLAELDAQIREQEATRRINDQRREELEAQVAQAHEDVKLAQRDAEVAQGEVVALHDASEALALALIDADDEVRRCEASLAAARDATHQARATAAEVGAAIQGVGRAQLQLDTRRASIAARREAVADRARRGAEDVVQLQEERRLALAARGDAEARRSPHDADRAAAEAAVQRTSEAYDVALAEQTAAEEALAAAQASRKARFEEQQARLRDIRERGRQWIAASEAAARLELEREDRAWRDRLSEQRTAASFDREAHLTAARAAAEAAEAGTVADLEAQVRIASSSRDTSAASVVTARDRAADLDGQGRQIARDLAKAEARQLTLRARLVAEGSLDHQPRLIDRLGDPPAALDRLGSRALAAFVTHPSVLVQAAAQREADQRIVAWFRPDATLPPAVRAPWAPDLATGLAQWTSLRAPIAGSGFRIDAEGWLTIGPPEDLGALAEQDAALETEIEALQSSLASLRQAQADADVALVTVTAERDEAEADLENAQRALVDAQQRLREAIAGAEQVAEQEVRLRTDEDEARIVRERDHVLALSRRRADDAIDALRLEIDRIAARWEARLATNDDDGMASMQAAVATTREAAQRALAERDRAQRESVELTRSWERAEAEWQAASRDVTRIEGELAKRARDDAELDAERATLDGQAAEVGRTEADLGLTLSQHERDAEVAREELERRTDAESIQGDRLATAEARRAELRTDGAALSARSDAAATRAERATTAIARAEVRADQATTAIAEAIRARDEAAAAVEAANEARGRAFDDYETARARLKRDRAALAEAEEEQAGLLDRVKRLGHRAEAVADRFRTVRSELEVIGQRISDRYQVDVDALLQDLFVARRLELAVPTDVAEGITIGDRRVEPVPPMTVEPEDLEDEASIVALVRQLERDRALIARFDTVNVAALEEYRELKARYDEMEAQRTDLEESIRGIQTAIAKLNQECRTRFRDAFDRVNEHFQVAYPRLVGGGQARLALTDETDLLECGVEIFVQPPGKRLQNLQLLSGGEKAMTAIALLIALFRVKPSPFCVLDEVDAPLDEANGARFNEMLREMATQSQFLVVTHNRKTMECADTLFGVTMANPGVSRLVSVQL